MGWSCTQKAFETMEGITKAICHEFDNQNQWEENGRTFFWELPYREHDDGHISGTVFEVRDGLCYRYSSVYIRPDGTVKRMPGSLKRLIQKVEGYYGMFLIPHTLERR